MDVPLLVLVVWWPHEDRRSPPVAQPTSYRTGMPAVNRKHHLLGPKLGSMTSRKLFRLLGPAPTGADRHPWQFATARNALDRLDFL